LNPSLLKFRSPRLSVERIQLRSLSNCPLLPLLYIDDNPHDRLLMQEAVRRAKTPFTLFSTDGQESAAAHFQPRPLNAHPNPYPRPALILLDYDMGLHTGADFLIWLRIQKQMTAIPVIMYSGSVGVRHIEQCYNVGATHFLRKSQTLSGVERIIRTLAICMRFSPPRFRPLTRLPEYEAVPSNQHSRIPVTLAAGQIDSSE
jgi:CheY-like chemotaxis protein